MLIDPSNHQNDPLAWQRLWAYNHGMPNDIPQSWRKWSRARWPLLAVGLAVSFAVVWWLGPLLLYHRTGTGAEARLKAITDTRTALFAGLLGVGALLTFWLNNRVHRVTEQGQITDRYTKAIEQLGSVKLEVRLGGIYALERIAVDSERDHPTVVEVLSAFVRTHSDPSTADSTPTVAQVLSDLLREAGVLADNDQPDVRPNKKSDSAADIQAAAKVLGRLPKQPAVRRGDLPRAQLAGAQLQGANLSGAQLQGADLSYAQLEGADLSDAKLEAADLSGAQLSGKAILARANLYMANLSDAQLFTADLLRANFGKANLSNAGLRWANLSHARLDGTDLTGADLNEAILNAAVLEGALHLRQEQLDQAKGDEDTRLPPGFYHPPGWAGTEGASGFCQSPAHSHQWRRSAIAHGRLGVAPRGRPLTALAQSV
jgi:uncharacterized protein YjbI with pentapeptide repeats